jgi:hypothetical protein
MIGRASSSANFFSIAHTICFRFLTSDSADCASTILSISGLQRSVPLGGEVNSKK